MRNPEKVLNSLIEHSKDLSYKYERLYRILYNEEMFYVAYQRTYAKAGNMTKGTGGLTIDQMSLSRIGKLIESLKDESYHPQPSRRVYIPKKNGKMRPLGVPDYDDKLVQEVIRMILEAIYEGSFENTSHGFRPNRSCHTALKSVKLTFGGAKWFVEGDIKGFFDNIDHEIMINILMERITDDKFIRLMRKFLKAGYMEEWIFHRTLSGTPQGGIISPILANIYLNKLDKHMEKLIQGFDKGRYPKRTTQYNNLQWRRELAKRNLKKSETEEERAENVKLIKALNREMTQTTCNDSMYNGYKRLKYVRYADDFIVGVNGSKEDAQQIKEEIKRFLHNELALELSDEKTLITHSETPAIFLGYEIYLSKTNLSRRKSNGQIVRAYNNRIMLKMPKGLVKKKLIENKSIEIKRHNGREQWKPKSRMMFSNFDDLEILARYNAEIQGLYNYYCIALNSSTLNSFKYIMEYSMYKTFAQKYRTTVVKICQKYKHSGIFTIEYTDKIGKIHKSSFYSKGFKQKRPSMEKSIDNLPSNTIRVSGNSLIDRLKAEKCEYCGAEDTLQMHHIRKVKNLKGKAEWEKFMIARHRKTIAVCERCHWKIHNGQMD